MKWKALPFLKGKELVNLPNAELNKIRAEQISMIFQDPMTSLNPYMKIGEQLMEVLQLHKGYDKQTAFAESVKMLDAVKMPEAKKTHGHVSARVFWRYASTGDDCDGPIMSSKTTHCR